MCRCKDSIFKWNFDDERFCLTTVARWDKAVKVLSWEIIGNRPLIILENKKDIRHDCICAHILFVGKIEKERRLEESICPAKAQHILAPDPKKLLHSLTLAVFWWYFIRFCFTILVYFLQFQDVCYIQSHNRKERNVIVDSQGTGLSSEKGERDTKKSIHVIFVV